MKKNSLLKDIAQIGIMVAFIEVAKFTLAGLPNVELTSFFLIMFALCFGNKVFFVIPIFILVEGAVYGVGIWWIMYLYIWPILVILTKTVGKRLKCFGLAMMSGAFGLIFGALCAIPYIFIGTFDGDFSVGIRVAFLYWVAGIPFDIVHGVANFVIMLVLYRPMKSIMDKAHLL